MRQGLTTILWEGVETYKSAIADQETLRRYGRGCPDDWLERNLYRHNSLGIGLMLVINLFLFGLLGVTVWAIQMIWIPFLPPELLTGLVTLSDTETLSHLMRPGIFFLWACL